MLSVEMEYRNVFFPGKLCHPEYSYLNINYIVLLTCNLTDGYFPFLCTNQCSYTQDNHVCRTFIKMMIINTLRDIHARTGLCVFLCQSPF